MTKAPKAVDGDIRKIVFLATAQHDPALPWLPNDRGIKRIEAAMRCLAEHPEARLVIAGGYANHLGFTYSDRMLAYIAKHFPEALSRLLVVSGLNNRTIDDIFQTTLIIGGLEEEQNRTFISSGCELFFVSEQIHHLRCVATFRTMGFKPTFVNSEADTTIYTDADLAMIEENYTPEKVLGLGEAAMQWWENAKKAAEAQAEVCAIWASLNPEEDAIWVAKITALLLELIKAGVYIESPGIGLQRPRPPIPTFLPLGAWVYHLRG